jgi:hypothetical protein
MGTPELPDHRLPTADPPTLRPSDPSDRPASRLVRGPTSLETTDDCSRIQLRVGKKGVSGHVTVLLA